jgi:GT2 family glycosyltransferase
MILNQLKLSNTSYPLVSVVVICWNNKKFLKNCLSSICSQSYQNIEIILTDNASTDGSVEFINKNFPVVRIIQNRTNLGFAEGNNVAMRLILKEKKSKYILILNPDTTIEQDFIKNLVESAERNSSIGAFAPKMLVMNRKNKISSAGGDCVFRCGDNLSRRFYFENTESCREEVVFGPSGAAAFYRVEMLKEIGLYDKFLFTYYEDVDMNFRIQKSGWGAMYVPNAVIYHFHSGSLNDFNPYKTYLLNRNKYLVILKNYPFSLMALYRKDLTRSFAAFAKYCFQNELKTKWIGIILFVSGSIPIVITKRIKLRRITKVNDKDIIMRFIEDHEQLMTPERRQMSFNEYLQDLRERS